MSNFRRNFKINRARKGKPQKKRSQASSVEYMMTNQRRVERIPKNLFAADAVILDLTYLDQSYQRNQVGQMFLSYRMRMNSIFDPDPSLGSGAIPGYTMWANMYGSYRVLKFHYDVEIANMEAFPIDVLVCPTVTDVGLNYNNTYDFLGNPLGKSHTLSSTGGLDKCRFVGSIDLGDFWGNIPQYCGDDGFGGTVGGNPGTMLFFNIGAVSTINFTAAHGIFTKGKFVYTVMLYKRQVQTT
jgi:hypothetical protein